MLATSPSPSIRPATTLESVAVFPSRTQYDQSINALHPRPALKSTESTRKHPFSPDLASRHPHRITSTRSLDRYSPPPRRVKMVDASTQYSPPDQQKASPSSITKTPTSTIAGLQLSEKDERAPATTTTTAATVATAATAAAGAAAAPTAATAVPRETIPHPVEPSTRATPETLSPHTQIKRQAAEPAEEVVPTTNGVESQEQDSSHHSPVKRARPDAPPVRLMPVLYENCNTRDLVVLISSMLMELIRYNDAIPLREGQLTRFHSRAPPGISVLDYLQRLTTHATLSPPILLSVVYYIDRLCALYPAFTISSLTVHRFLITSATVASKGLSDSFWTNKTYARVGGVSMKELALLELEFLTRMEWRIVPKPEVLVDYYKSLIERNSQYQLESS